MSEVRIAETTSIVLFDGVCHLCNTSVNFIINHDRRQYFKFTPLQSTLGQQLLRQYNLSSLELDTLVLIEKGKAYTRSTAALRIAKQLSGLWPGAYLLIVIPRVLRDAVYRVIARNRYKWFGKREACMMPTPDVKERFLGAEDAI